jgi:hypothetical protein
LKENNQNEAKFDELIEVLYQYVQSYGLLQVVLLAALKKGITVFGCSMFIPLSPNTFQAYEHGQNGTRKRLTCWKEVSIALGQLASCFCRYQRPSSGSDEADNEVLQKLRRA